ncbi:Ig-like domain-containing protein [Butyrivibrio sp. MC2013]|uniref:Ig-like domain-containing protein n=1 Tax=Butyrivibrio sp. MC2013 TaxID=1280686 RepID=UPI0003F7E831|nr:Ig-like domain-containing protein [Butyrivibrio sp. MC2013]
MLGGNVSAASVSDNSVSSGGLGSSVDKSSSVSDNDNSSGEIWDDQGSDYDESYSDSSSDSYDEDGYYPGEDNTGDDGLSGGYFDRTGEGESDDTEVEAYNEDLSGFSFYSQELEEGASFESQEVIADPDAYKSERALTLSKKVLTLKQKSSKMSPSGVLTAFLYDSKSGSARKDTNITWFTDSENLGFRIGNKDIESSKSSDKVNVYVKGYAGSERLEETVTVRATVGDVTYEDSCKVYVYPASVSSVKIYQARADKTVDVDRTMYAKGATQDLTVRIKPAFETAINCRYSSSNESVIEMVALDTDGNPVSDNYSASASGHQKVRLRTVNPGTATITAIADGKKTSVKIKVLDKANNQLANDGDALNGEGGVILLTATADEEGNLINIAGKDEGSYVLKTNQKARLKAFYTDGAAVRRAVSYKVISGSKNIKISGNQVTGLKAGNAVIRASYKVLKDDASELSTSDIRIKVLKERISSSEARALAKVDDVKIYKAADVTKGVYTGDSELPSSVEALNMTVGDKEALSALVYPLGSSSDVRWTSSSKAVSVTDGVVTANRSGSAWVTARYSKSKYSRVKVYVSSRLDNVTLDKKEVSITAGKNAKLTVKTSPSVANKYMAYEWKEIKSPEDPVAVSYSDAKLIRGTASGGAAISDNAGQSLTFGVSDSAKNMDTAYIMVTARIKGLDEIDPETGTADYHYIESQCSYICKVYITRKAQSVQFKAIGAGSYSESLPIIYVNPNTDPEVGQSASLKLTAEAKYSNAITLSDAANPDLAWASSSVATASVAADGTVTAIKPGKAVISASIGGKKVSRTVVVRKNPTALKLSAKSLKVNINKTGGFTVKAANSGASVTKDEVTWSVSNEDKLKIKVSSDGKTVKVTAIGYGGAGPEYVTATLKNGRQQSVAIILPINVDELANNPVRSVDKPAEGTYYNILDYGARANDGNSDLDALNTAIYATQSASSTIDTVYIPAGRYDINASIVLQYVSDIKIVMDDEAYLHQHRVDAHIFLLNGCSNVSIMGGHLVGNQPAERGNDEGHGIAMNSCTKISISDMEIEKCDGDGIYFGRQGSSKNPTSDVTISRCYIHDNHRNNVTFVFGKNARIEYCKIVTAVGEPPACCIEIEGNDPDEVSKDIYVYHSYLENVKQSGSSVEPYAFASAYTWAKPRKHGENVTFEDCAFKGVFANYSTKNLTVKNCQINGKYEYGYGYKITRK